MGQSKHYDQWIEGHYPTPELAYGQCDEATKQLVAAFPELQRVRGHYYCWTWGERSHWWAVAEDGTIVDPTARQFPSGGRGMYVPWEEGAEEPSGKCPNCGGYVYGGGTVCSDQCGDAFVRSML